jgi:hypothetical protein
MTLASWLLAGGAIGLLNGLSLRWTVTRFRPDASSQAAVLAVAGAMLRWGLAAGLLIAALQQGIACGLLAFAGLQFARWGVVCWFNLQA